jgi:hypothetical protein
MNITPAPDQPPEDSFEILHLRMEEGTKLLANQTRDVVTSLRNGFGDGDATPHRARTSLAVLCSYPSHTYKDNIRTGTEEFQKIKALLQDVYLCFRDLALINSQATDVDYGLLWTSPQGPEWMMRVLATLLAPFQCQFYMVRRGHGRFVIWTDFQNARIPHSAEMAQALANALAYNS